MFFHKRFIIPSLVLTVLVGVYSWAISDDFAVQSFGFGYLVTPLLLQLILYSKTQYIILDEPFNGVAPIYRDDIKSLIREASRSKGILLTDHDYRNVIDVSDRLLLLYDGGIKNIKDKHELVYYGYIPN